ncbi:DUF3857 domain-containing protein [Parabacteroides merdae]|uniref:DUF3857 domain-containing protein n=1 Tax=Parabacteroides merdae TaxID=46503 RepID=UPI001C233C3A|nr:DUF3857 domain-containing protein [Parabacteroides merdae]MBU9059151.1 DUF3858 domain-containing protein [Parabacteroides merdae]MCG4835057.1 DUF3857 domain-containing protein [Parabacteroides merdae]MCQ5193341.1 DUF3857 domain-containing protein [Parabacteroides merdae]
MIQNKHKFAFLLCMLLMTTTVFGASEAEYKKLAKTWTLNADGSQEFRYKMELTLFTHTAMNGTYGESFIVYNPQYQELKINSSYTKQKDGTIIKTPDNAFVEVLPRNAADAPAYNHLKEMVVVHTGLELGATIYLDYTVTSKPGYLPEVDIFEELLQSSPVKEYTLTIVTPEVKELAYTLTNNPAKASVKRSGGTCTTSWTLRNLPASSRAPFVYVKNGDVPFLAATTYASEGEALATLLKQFNPSGDPQLTTLAESLTEGKKKDEDKLEAILKYTTNHIANNGLTLDQTGYRLRPADAVMSTAYGTEAEKANLLAGLLDGAGFKAEPMATYQAYADKGLALKAVDQLFVSCMVNGELYLFSTSSTHRPQTVNFDRTPLFSLQTGKPVAIAVPQDYQIKSDIAVRFKDGKVTTSTKESVGKELMPYFTTGNSENEQTAPLKVENGYATISLPDAEYGFSHLPYGYLNSQRKENLLIPRPVNEVYTYTIECPENMELRTPETDKTIRNAAGSLTISVKKNGRTATVTRSLELNKQLYTPAEYKELRQLLTEWSDVNGKTLLFSVR